ncbi:hypothetical protein ABVK25_012060 [Lepraria finkii]|uniref:NACHT domain-containing protein n=1 Tax=Lepraria finkii TaxID=1340010 RepID=A0ABR4AL20_9LECA
MEAFQDIANFFKSAYIVVDGVDQHPRRAQILDIIRKTLVPRDLRVMVTCRQTVSVEKVLKYVGTAISYLQMSEDHVRLDFKVLIPKRLQSFPFIEASEEPQEDIERKLIEDSRGMHVWTNVLIKRLRNCYSHYEIKTVMSSPSNTIDNLWIEGLI